MAKTRRPRIPMEVTRACVSAPEGESLPDVQVLWSHDTDSPCTVTAVVMPPEDDSPGIVWQIDRGLLEVGIDHGLAVGGDVAVSSRKSAVSVELSSPDGSVEIYMPWARAALLDLLYRAERLSGESGREPVAVPDTPSFLFTGRWAV